MIMSLHSGAGLGLHAAHTPSAGGVYDNERP